MWNLVRAVNDHRFVGLGLQEMVTSDTNCTVFSLVRLH